MARNVIAVRGYRELMKATTQADDDTREFVREAFRASGEVVRADAARAFAPIDTRTALGFRVRVRQRGVAVAQSMRKVTGKHPEYGAKQMRYLYYSTRRNQTIIEREFEQALGKVADRFEGSP